MATVWGWETFFEEVTVFLQQLERQEGRGSQQFSEYALERLQVTIVNITNIRDIIASSQSIHGDQELSYYVSSMNELLQCMQSLSVEWEKYLDDVLSSPIATTGYQARGIVSGHRGRPKFDINGEQLEYLSSLSFTWTEIASLLGVSRMTIYRRRLEYGMLHQGRPISDSDLRDLIREMRIDFPEMGEVMVLGRLRSLGIIVTRDRVRNTVRATDPLNTALRGPRGLTVRRPYSVPGPKSLWHIGRYK